MPTLKIAVIGVFLHIVAVIGSVYIENLTSATGVAYYGGESGLLPDSGGPYGAIYEFLVGSSTPQLAEQGDGLLGFLKWIFIGPLSIFGDLVGLLLVTSTFAYPIINIIPMERFGLWFRILVHALGIFFTLMLVSKLLEWAGRNGVMSNPYLLVALGAVGSIGLISHALGG